MFTGLKIWWWTMRLKSVHSYVRSVAAAEVLGHLGDARAVEPLIKALGGGRCYVRCAAVEALGQLGDARAVEPLINALGDREPSVRSAAVTALGQLGEPAWQVIIKGDDGDWMRLGSCGDDRVVEPLIKALGHGDWDVCCSAAEALGQLGDARAVEPLINALGDRKSDVRRAAAEALGQLGDTRVIEPLINALRDRKSDVRRAAAAALVKMGTRAVEPLINALGHSHHYVRCAVVEALGQLGDTRAVEPLIKALDSRDWRDVCCSAAEALGQLGDARAVEPLINALGDSDHDVRCAAVKALEQLGEPAWQELIKGEQGDFARLGSCGDARALQPLLRALAGTKEQGVLLEVISVLVEFPCPEVVNALCAHISTFNDDYHCTRHIRQACARSLTEIVAKEPNLLKGRWTHMQELIKEPHADSWQCAFHSDGGVEMSFPDPPGLDF